MFFYVLTESKIIHTMKLGLVDKFSGLSWLIVITGILYSSRVSAAPGDLNGYVLHVQLAPAVCMMDSTIRKQRKCLDGNSMTILGLYPETQKRDCETLSHPMLSPIQKQVVARLIQDEHTRDRLWHSIGACVPMSASNYFRTMVTYATNLKIPADLLGIQNKKVEHSALKNQFLKLNPKLKDDAIHFFCHTHRQQTLLTSIQICYTPKGQYKSCDSRIVSNCPKIFQIQSTY